MDLVVALERRLLGEGKAARTVREYMKWARRLDRWARLRGLDLATLEPHQVRAWIDETVPPGRESRKQAYTAVKHLYAGRDDQPWLAIRVPNKRRGKPRPLTEDERQRLRDAAIMVGGRRGLATLGMLMTACRPSELAVWRWDGITWYREPDGDGSVGRIRFWRTKVRDWHEVPVRPALGIALDQFRPPTAEAYLFPGNNGRPHVTTATVWEWVRDVAALADVRDVNPRRLRTTAVTRVLELTDSIDVAAQLAGHQDPNVTRNYYAATSWRRLADGTAALD